MLYLNILVGSEKTGRVIKQKQNFMIYKKANVRFVYIAYIFLYIKKTKTKNKK